MKTSHFIYALIAIGLFASCGQTTTNENLADTGNQIPIMSNNSGFINYNGGFQNNVQQTNMPVQNNAQQRPLQSEKKPIRLRDDATGMVMVTFPVPNSWNPAQGQPDVQLEGPGGIKIYKEMTNTFYFSSDAATNNSIKEQGFTVKAPLSPEDLLRKEFQPMAEQSGSKMTNSYPLKAIADTESRIDAMYIKSLPETSIFHATVSEWEDKNGTPSIIVIKYKRTEFGQGFMSWGYTISDMTADQSVYPQAKIDFLDALIQKEANPAYVDYVNGKNQKMENQQEKQEKTGYSQIPESNYDKVDWTKSSDAYNNSEVSKRYIDNACDKVTFMRNGKLYNPVTGEDVPTYDDMDWSTAYVEIDKSGINDANQAHQNVLNDIYDPNTEYKIDDSWEELGDSGDDGWN